MKDFLYFVEKSKIYQCYDSLSFFNKLLFWYRVPKVFIKYRKFNNLI